MTLIPESQQHDQSFHDLHLESNFEAFFKALYPQLCIFCKIKYNLDAHLAEDIVNTSFSKLWEARYTLNPHLSARAYLFKIVNNQCLNLLKHQKVQDQYIQSQLNMHNTPAPLPDADSLDLKQLRDAIDTAIAELPDQMRKIFELNRHDGLKYTEIATRLHLSVKTVETQMSRALLKLRQKLAAFIR
ncbi:RNA polymerase sigma-70 factor [Chitinophaga sancti]|uniref:RNA polymerase sigma-70 factor n=1 Tax=Chitinophaga sancti TaxID=1004 RepID=A0A1K1M2H2_9BACT|nr:RNA polymerase sigma-70 factor [Chitinophaga sancti]WQD64682.1 RNA polymerase sigma-70 factor [Chitinophaga sancti]WQG89696.1 RNA polymerase sigma-70 factor [Chitinophaga sancti]SFW17354.1 RNA polymerase sigma-70 factor, ECF subfamily [Chitinophaga sancti]